MVDDGRIGWRPRRAAAGHRSHGLRQDLVEGRQSMGGPFVRIESAFEEVFQYLGGNCVLSLNLAQLIALRRIGGGGGRLLDFG